ncbi:MBL fold metallo-hydrolase [Luteimonas suaedae]|uniref:MBL fold metallo-hydrolase n=1 Tax=Luteimonas suaedae TaxID=2605430 RepID=UPI0011F017A4|nr:MBL fold metallo-hydrolase [Luteimonas suaedae]
MRIPLLALLLAIAPQAAGQTVPGSLDVHWNAGAPDCEATPQDPLQVHAYAPQTFILRQSPCTHFEANFLYLLVGHERALLIDSGAIAEAARMPLAQRVLELLPRRDGAPLPLIVAHSHGHRDHRAGDALFASHDAVEVVDADLEGVKAFFGLDRWPDGVASLDLGGRTVTVLPAPGHHPAHVLFYDDRTALLFSGDFLLPGRLLIDDTATYRTSAARAAEFFRDRPVTHVLGGHIELDVDGRLFPHGAQHHPHEHPLQLDKQALLELPAALEAFNGFRARHADFVLVHPMHNLAALAVAAVAALALIGWALRRLWRRRRAASARGRD